MISFDQVLLLEEKVESAVKKIEQLNAENAALRSKVAELSNALNAKTEQFSSFQNDQSKIEEGILKALSRLNAVENVVLSAAGAASVSAAQNVAVEAVQNEPQSEQSEQNAPQPEQIPQSEPIAQDSAENGESESVAENSEITQSEEPVVSDAVSESNAPVESVVQGGDAAESAADAQQISSEPVLNESSNSDSLTPDIDFEFGDSDETSEPPVENQNSAAQDETGQNQPLFDIF